MPRKGGGNNRNRAAKLVGRQRKIFQRKKQRSSDNELVANGLIQRKKLASFTKALVSYSVYAAYTLGCAQFGQETKTSSGRKQYVRGSLKQRLWHYLTTTLLYVSVIHRFAVTVAKISEDELLNLDNVICIAAFLVYFLGWAMSLGVVFNWRESLQAVNTWDPLVAAFADNEDDITPYDDVPSALKIVFGVFISASVASAYAMGSLLFATLPFTLYSTLKAVGLVPEVSFMTPFLWELMLVPAELAMVVWPVCSANLGWVILEGSIGVQKVCIRAVK